MKIAVGLSGGVDSAVAALLLKNAGYDVQGIILNLKPGNMADNDISDAKAIANHIGIDLQVVDLREEFRNKIISDFESEYLSGRTPNPCIECNKHIKFGAMMKAARELGCEKIATGHYARVDFSEGRYLLKKSESAKDQSYFLFRLSQDQLSGIVFPLNNMSKEEIRNIAEKNNLPVSQKKDSLEICFVPDDDYIAFLKSEGISSKPGNIIDTNGNIIGSHIGITNYTIGQRKGLGAYGKPMFVTSISAENNTVTIGENGQQYSSGLIADRPNYISLDNLTDSIRGNVKIRFRAKEQPATITPVDNGFKVIFDEPQRSVTPGQSAVIYIGDTVVGGGRIISQIP